MKALSPDRTILAVSHPFWACGSTRSKALATLRRRLPTLGSCALPPGSKRVVVEFYEAPADVWVNENGGICWDSEDSGLRDLGVCAIPLRPVPNAGVRTGQRILALKTPEESDTEFASRLGLHPGWIGVLRDGGEATVEIVASVLAHTDMDPRALLTPP